MNKTCREDLEKDIKLLKLHNTEQFCKQCPAGICIWKDHLGCAPGWYDMLKSRQKEIDALVEALELINASNGIYDYKRVREIAREALAKYRETSNDK